MRKTAIAILVFIILLLSSILVIGLWNSRGGIAAFVDGQRIPLPDLTQCRNASMKETIDSFQVTVTIPDMKPASRTTPEFISFAIDLSQVTGGKWWNPKADKEETGSGSHHAPVFDFNRPKLDRLVSALTPAYLRIGGSESDKIFYDMKTTAKKSDKIPAGYESVLTAGQWDSLNAFVKRNGLKLVFTLNAGPSSRRADMSWNPANAEELMRYSMAKKYPVAVWELGNEVNLFWYLYGRSRWISPSRYHEDIKRARKLMAQYYPDSLFGGQGGAFWPVLGEPLSFFFGFTPKFIEKSGALLDVISWHYYPQQSRRGPIASRRAHPSRLLDADNLDEVAYWGDALVSLRDAYSPKSSLWIGETGNAQFGGEPGVSDTYIGGLWWLDQLGLTALHGHRVVIRQSLTGMNYGLIDDEDLKPRPDYWNSLIWNKTMGNGVLRTSLSGENLGKIRIYAHIKNSEGKQAVTLVIINLDHLKKAIVTLNEISPSSFELYSITTPDVLGNEILLNGSKCGLGAGNAIPALKGKTISTSGPVKIMVNPLSYSFLVVPVGKM